MICVHSDTMINLLSKQISTHATTSFTEPIALLRYQQKSLSEYFCWAFYNI